MDTAKQKLVEDQYINGYVHLVQKTLNALRSNQANLQIPYAQFLFSVIDYFGLLYRVADKDLYNKILKDNFLDFIASSYYPFAVRCKSDLLYFIRNGVMHQIFAKAISIGHSPANHLFFTDTNNGNIPALNLRYLDQITRAAILAFVADLQTKAIYIERLHDHLITQHYGLDDHKELGIIVTNIFGGDSVKIIDDCI